MRILAMGAHPDDIALCRHLGDVRHAGTRDLHGRCNQWRGRFAGSDPGRDCVSHSTAITLWMSTRGRCAVIQPSVKAQVSWSAVGTAVIDRG
jgi:hypothetical protein